MQSMNSSTERSMFWQQFTEAHIQICIISRVTAVAHTGMCSIIVSISVTLKEGTVPWQETTSRYDFMNSCNQS